MKLLLDTSVLVAAMVDSHPAHERALPWLQKVKNGTHTGFISAHSLAELYSILTTLPIKPQISPTDANRLIHHNIIKSFEIVTLSDEDYIEVIERLSKLEIMGGATYDAVILRAAENVNVDQVITLNAKDFRRVNPSLSNKILTP